MSVSLESQYWECHYKGRYVSGSVSLSPMQDGEPPCTHWIARRVDHGQEKGVRHYRTLAELKAEETKWLEEEERPHKRKAFCIDVEGSDDAV